MSINIPQLDYGTVTGRFLVEVSDSEDADLKPDVYPASGYVVFTPGTNFATVNSATPVPATVFPQKVIGVLDSDGYLHQAVFNGPTGTYSKTVDGEYVPAKELGVRLQSTDDTDLNPSDWSWRVDFFFNYNKNPITYPGFNFQLPTNKTIDLALVKPISERPGEYTIVGPQGPRGEKGDPGPSTVLSIGTVTTKPTGSPAEVTISGTSPSQTLNFALPAGPIGPSGGPIPSGGQRGDSVFKGPSTASEWRFTDGIQDNLFPNGSLEYGNEARWSSSMTSKTTDAPPGYSSSMWCAPGATSFSALPSDPIPVVVGDQYIFEVWVKADKPNSNLYVEMRNQDGTHTGNWTWIEGGNNSASMYPIGQYTVPTEWTKIKARGTLVAGTTHIRFAAFYFNHVSGSEKTASVGMAGARVYRAPSLSTISTDIIDLLPTSDQRTQLNNISNSATPNSLVQRTFAGSGSFSYVTVTSDNPTSDLMLTPKKYVDSKILENTRKDLISTMRTPTVMAHRGGASVYPEESMEGFIAASESGYVPEMDIQFLSDSTPVLCHDETVDRTMIGGTGAVSSMTQDQWRKLQIVSVVPEGKSSKPVFFEDVLDRLGGQILLMPEIKTAATNAQIDIVINMIKARGLEKCVIIQSFSWTAAQRIANAGLTALFLMNNTIAQTATALKAAGIYHVGVSKSMSNTNMSTLINGGIKVYPYTCNTRKEVTSQPSTIAGFFSDDPWTAADELQTSGTGWWLEGKGWPSKIITCANSGAAGSPYDGTKNIYLRGGGLYIPRSDTVAMTHIALDHLIGGSGLIDRPLIVSARFVFSRRTPNDSANVGFTIFKNTSDKDAMFVDGAKTGQSGFTFGVRRNGAAQAWKYDNGGSAVSIASKTDFWSGTGGSRQGQIILTLELAESWMGLSGDGPNATMTASDPLTGPFRVMLRSSGAEVTIYDVTVGNYINSSL